MLLSRPIGLLAIVLSMTSFQSVLALADDATPPSTQPTGAFVTTFTESSPQTDWKKLGDRFNRPYDKLGDRYVLAQKPFVVYVPSGDPPPEGFGVWYAINENGFNAVPQNLRPLLDQRHLIFLSPSEPNLTLGATLGLSLDGIYNLEKRYKINGKRVFMIGTGWVEPVSMATSDVFVGSAWIWSIGWIMRITEPNGTSYMPNMPAPSEELLRTAQTRAYVVGYETDYEQMGKAIYVPAMRQEGFQHVFKTVVTMDTMAPSIHPDLAAQLLDLLESVPAAESPHHHADVPAAAGAGTQPDSAPKADPAAQELGAAQMLIANGRSDLAKDKLQEIIQKYPGDPAAAQAQTLLDQLNAQ